MRIFWPVFLGVSLVCVLLVWFMAPSFRSSVPEDLRSSWAYGVGVLQGIDLEGMERMDAERREAAKNAERQAEAEAAARALEASRPRPKATPVRRAPAAQTVAQNVPAAPAGDSEPAQPAAPEEPEDPIPSTRGIMQTDYRDATWGIVNAVTPYRSLADNEELGKAAAGAVFVVEQRQPAAGGGVEFIGNFRNQRLEEPVIISGSRLYCFTGSYDSLTLRQRSALTSYYKKRGEAERIKREIAKENGSKSPYFAKAVEAKTKWDEMVRTTEKLEVALRTDKNANASQIRDKLARMKGEMAVQQSRVKDLSAKHKAWKEKNAPNMQDPEDDPRVQKLRDEMQGFAKLIPGLAF